MTPHPAHHVHVPRRTPRRSLALFAALLVVVGTPLVVRALDAEAAPAPDQVEREVVMDAPASATPGAVAEPTVDPVLAVRTDTDAGDERRERVAMQEALDLPTDTVPVPVPPAGTSAEQWAALRDCESGGDYSIANPSGKYRGAYQFDRSTWNSVAEAHAPYLVGVDPAAASPADQDAMAFALYGERGAGPWPQCGRHLR